LDFGGLATFYVEADEHIHIYIAVYIFREDEVEGECGLIYRSVVFKLFWFTAHCKTHKNFLVHFVYKIKNILIYFKL
jgi:hypothetical protein